MILQVLNFQHFGNFGTFGAFCSINVRTRGGAFRSPFAVPFRGALALHVNCPKVCRRPQKSARLAKAPEV